MKSYEEFRQSLDEIFGLFDSQSRRERVGRKKLEADRWKPKNDPEKEEREENLRFMKGKEEKDKEKEKQTYSVDTSPPEMNVHYLDKKNQLRKTKSRYPHSKRVRFPGERERN